MIDGRTDGWTLIKRRGGGMRFTLIECESSRGLGARLYLQMVTLRWPNEISLLPYFFFSPTTYLSPLPLQLFKGHITAAAQTNSATQDSPLLDESVNKYQAVLEIYLDCRHLKYD